MMADIIEDVISYFETTAAQRTRIGDAEWHRA